MFMNWSLIVAGCGSGCAAFGVTRRPIYPVLRGTAGDFTYGRGLHIRLAGEACEGVEQGRPIQHPVIAGRAAPVVGALQDPRLV
jgi:hypothetical protein